MQSTCAATIFVIQKSVRYAWDGAKAEANLAKHGVPMEAVRGFDWKSAVEVEDDRFDYGERRMIAIGFIGDRLHVLIYVRRHAWRRVISLRKANDRERARYEQATK